MKLKSLSAAALIGALALAAPAAAKANERVILSIEGVGDWVVVTHRVCVNAGGRSVCHTWQTHEFRREQQVEVERCTTINGVSDC